MIEYHFVINFLVKLHTLKPSVNKRSSHSLGLESYVLLDGNF